MSASTEPQVSALGRLVARVREHPVVAAVAAVVGLVTLLETAFGQVSAGVEWLRDRAEPDRDTYAALEELRLDLSPARVEELLGTPAQQVPLCEGDSCAPEAAAMEVLAFERPSVTVRVVIDGTEVVLYAVTLTEPDAEPPIRWFDGERGTLGRTGYAAAMADLDPGVTPTSIAFLRGTARTTYVEVAALGAPGDYQGLLLGHVTSGAPTTFDAEAATLMGDASGPGTDVPLEAATAFREASEPNTYGVYRDDGPAGQLLDSADEVSSVFLVTE